MAAMRARMRKEIEMLERDPPHGISAWPKDEQIDHLEAQIVGPEETPYENGVFHLDIQIPERYPFEPPKVKFLTPIYHPNIDDAGRICLDTLKMQPKGSWLPSVNISTLLATIRLLMAEPNADDGLMPDITDLFKHNREMFNHKAKELTLKHAQGSLTNTSTSKENVQSTQNQEAKKPIVSASASKKRKISSDSSSDSDSDSDSSNSSSEEEKDEKIHQNESDDEDSSEEENEPSKRIRLC